MKCSASRRSPARRAAIHRPRRCQRMPANSFTNARAAARCSSRRRGIAACSALTAICLAHQYKKGERVVAPPDVASARKIAAAIAAPQPPAHMDKLVSARRRPNDHDLRRRRCMVSRREIALLVDQAGEPVDSSPRKMLRELPTHGARNERETKVEIAEKVASQFAHAYREARLSTLRMQIRCSVDTPCKRRGVSSDSRVEPWLRLRSSRALQCR